MKEQIKRWICCHLCSDYFMDAAIEGWKRGCDIGYEAGKAGKEKPPPPPFVILMGVLKKCRGGT